MKPKITLDRIIPSTFSIKKLKKFLDQDKRFKIFIPSNIKELGVDETYYHGKTEFYYIQFSFGNRAIGYYFGYAIKDMRDNEKILKEAFIWQSDINMFASRPDIKNYTKKFNIKLNSILDTIGYKH